MVVFLLLREKTYSIGAFADLNGDGHYEGGEPVDYVKNVHPIPLSDPHLAAQAIELRLSATNGLPPGQKVELPAEGTVPGGDMPVAIGAIADLFRAPVFRRRGRRWHVETPTIFYWNMASASTL